MSDLLVDVHTPALGSGRAARTYAIARALAAGPHGLRLLYVPFGAAAPDAAFQGVPGLQLEPVTVSRGVRRLLAYASARRQGVPDGFARGVSPELAAAAARLAVEGQRVIADGPVAAAALAGLARRRPVIYNAHNLESGFRHELGAGELGGAERLRAFERGVLARSAESWMVSEADIAGAREICPEARLRYVPNAVDVAAITPVPSGPRPPLALFVASFRYAPNRDALRFLVEDVFPLVWARRADARLMLVGAGLDQPPDDRRVQSLGFVDDLAAVYGEAACAVVPLRQSGGSPLKFVEALAYGLPVVATTRAAAGLAVRDGEDCLLAEDAPEFAERLLTVFDGGAVGVGARGRELASARYSIEALTVLLSA